MAKSVSLSGTVSLNVTDTLSSKVLLDFTHLPSYTITTDSVNYGEVAIPNTTPKVINLTTPTNGHYLYLEVVDDPDNAQCTFAVGGTLIGTLANGEFSFIKIRSGSNITFQQNTSQTNPVVVKYFTIEY